MKLQIWLGLLLIFVFAGCAITSGSTFSGAVRADAGSSDSSTEGPGDGPGDEPDPGDLLTVRTDPSGATVWIDNRIQGSTPFSTSDIEPGRYRLRVEKDGYYAESRWIDIYDNTSLVIDLDLEQIVGYVVLDSVPPGAEFILDGSSVSSGVSTLPVGQYRVRARKFGYEDQTRSVDVFENSTTRVVFTLKPAAFRVSDVRLSHDHFNPHNPGGLGNVRLSFSVTAPGSAYVAVENDAGERIERFSLPEFTTWDQQARWPTHDTPPLQDGEYVLLLDLTGDDGSQYQRSAVVVVDSRLVVLPALVWHGAPGLLYAPTISPLPRSIVQVGLAGAGVATVINHDSVSRFPVGLSARVGLGSAIELTAHGRLVANSETNADRVSAGLSLQWVPVIVSTPFLGVSAGLSVGGTYRTPDTAGLYTGPDTFTNFPGFVLGLPLGIRTGPVTLVGEIEYLVAPAAVNYGETLPPNELTQLLYGRAGLRLDAGRFATGLSLAVRSEPLVNGLVLDLPVAAGLEAHWTFAETPIVLSSFAAGEFESWRNFYVMGGAGLSVLF